MWKNLSIEWLKLKYYRTFKWIMALFVICLIGSNYIGYQFKSISTARTKGGLDMLIGNPFGFPDVWQSVTYISSFLLFLPGLLMAILITNEYNFKTHRQNVIDGMSRKEFAITKIVLALLVAVFSTVIVFLIAVGTGLASGSQFSFFGSHYIFYFLLQAVTYTMAGLLLGFLIKKSGLAIIIYLVYAGFIKNLLSILANRYLSGIGSYFPVSSSDNLIPFPFFQKVTSQIMTPNNYTWLLITSAIYLVAFYWLILSRYQKQDL